MLTREHLAVARIASKGPAGALNGVSITPDGVVFGTDGHAILAVYEPTPTPIDEFPTGRASAPVREWPEKGIVIPRETAEALAKAIPRERHLPTLNHAVAETPNAAGDTVFFATDLEQDRRIVAKSVGEPLAESMGKAIGNNGVFARSAFNVDLLIGLLQAVKAAGASVVTIGLVGDKDRDSLLLRITGGTERFVFAGALMSCRSNELDQLPNIPGVPWRQPAPVVKQAA